MKNTYYLIRFQFHKVRLKVTVPDKRCGITQFQFHKVRLKVIRPFLSLILIGYFNSIRYD